MRPLVQGKASTPPCTFRLVIETHSAIPVSSASARFLSLPVAWAAPLPPRIGQNDRGQDYCLNWRLALDSGLGAPQNSGLFFGKGPVQITTMENCTAGGGPAGRSLVVAADFSERLLIGTVPVQLRTASKDAEHQEGPVPETLPSYVPFLTGTTEISSGVIHVLREPPPTHGAVPSEACGQGPCSGEEEEEQEQEQETVCLSREFAPLERGSPAVGVVFTFRTQSVVLILAIPSIMSPSDLLNFIEDGHLANILQIRLLRDAAPNRYMSLIKFKSERGARDFAASHDGRSFSLFAPEVCHVVSVRSVEFSTRASILEPLFDENEFRPPPLPLLLPSADLLEIPTCPVCLERIDSAATGVMIVICNHKFHCQCLSRWGDGSCPVCRYALQNEKNATHTQCMACGEVENIWICLICGNAGCGRYEEGHANEHYSITGHNFALELDTHRVWDYVGDNYVHRLIQNKEDGKLVQIPGPDDEPADSKAAKPAVDPDYYMSLMVAQLESQRVFYEERLEKVEGSLAGRVERMAREHAAETHSLGEQIARTQREMAEQHEQFLAEKTALQEKIKRISQSHQVDRRDLESERSMSTQAARAVEVYSVVVREREEQIRQLNEQIHQLNEQIHDLMLHIETQQRIASPSSTLSHDLRGGSLVIEQGPVPSKPARHSGRRRNR